jgi:RNA polymerase primary sigma factor
MFETSENLPKYFKSIQKLQPLSTEEEKSLAQQIQAGSQIALHKLVKHNLKIVVTIANRHIGQGVPIDDLIQEGNIGLFEAAQRFDPNSDARFITYASLWVRKRINEAVVAQGRIVRLPHNQEYDIYKAKMAGEEVQNLTTIEIDAPIGEEGDATLGDVLLNDQPEVMIEFEKEEIKFRVKKMINVLDKERDRKVIKAYFGIDCDYEMPTEVIAQRFDLTNVRVCQIVKAALTKMKEAAV